MIIRKLASTCITRHVKTELLHNYSRWIVVRDYVIRFLAQKVQYQLFFWPSGGTSHRGVPAYSKATDRKPWNYSLPASIFLLLIAPLWGAPRTSVLSQDLHHYSETPLKQLQEEIKHQQAYLPMEHFQTLSRELGLAPSDLRLRSMFDPKARAMLIKQNSTTTLPLAPAKKETSRTTLIHMRKEGGGKPIISMQEVMTPQIELLESKMDEIIRTAHQTVKESQKKIIKQFAIPELPRCLRSHTDKTALKPKVTGREKEIISDFLFVAPTHATTNSKEIFGESVEFIVYDSSKPSPFGLLAKNYQVSCLPYRVRSTGTFLFKHYGDDALKNFNGDPHGDGEKLL